MNKKEFKLCIEDNKCNLLKSIISYRKGINYIDFIDGLQYILNKNPIICEKCEQKDCNCENNSSEEEILVYCCKYCDKEFETLKGVTYHENVYCKNKNISSKNQTHNQFLKSADLKFQ